MLGWKQLGHEKRLRAYIINYADDLAICCRARADEALVTMRSMVSFLVAVATLVVAGALLIHHGFRATNQPSKLELTIAHTARNYSIPNAARDEDTPLYASPQNLQDGREAFRAKCQICHDHGGD